MYALTTHTCAHIHTKTHAHAQLPTCLPSVMVQLKLRDGGDVVRPAFHLNDRIYGHRLYDKLGDTGCVPGRLGLTQLTVCWGDTAQHMWEDKGTGEPSL